MQTNKLFSTLVVTGALIVTGSVYSNNLQSQGTEIGMQAETELEPCFCDHPENCVVDADGKAQVKDGFVCCWGTSCEPQE